MALLDEVVQFREEEQRIGLILFAPASIGSFVASGTIGIGLDEKRIVVAIDFDIDQMKVVAARLSFRLKALARTAKERHKPCFLRLSKRFLVHIAEHQHRFRRGILYDGRH